MIRRSTWIVLALLVVIVAAAVYLSKNPPTPGGDETPAPTSDITYLFDTETGIPVSSIRIQDADGNQVEVNRGEEGWKIDKPEAAEADQGMVEAAASQISVLRVLKTIEIEPKEVGLDKPAITITIGFSDKNEYTLLIGAETPSGSAYYAKLKDGEIIILDRNGIDALKNLLTAPPYLETPVPTPGGE